MFGDMCFRVDKFGSFRLPDRVYGPEPAPVSTPSAPAIYPSSWVPPPRGVEDSSYDSDFSGYRSEESYPEADDRDVGVESYESSYLPTHVLCAVISTANGGEAGAAGRRDETGSSQDTIHVTEDDRVVARGAMQGGTLLPEDATREQIACYRRLMEDERNEVKELEERLAERKRKADESSARRAALSSMSGRNSFGRNVEAGAPRR